MRRSRDTAQARAGRSPAGIIPPMFAALGGDNSDPSLIYVIGLPVALLLVCVVIGYVVYAIGTRRP